MKQILILLTVIAASFAACENGPFDCIDGDGKLVRETRFPGVFNSLKLSSDFNVFVIEGSSSEILIEAEQSLMSYIDLKKSGNRITIKERDNRCLRNTLPINIYVTTTGLSKIECSGSGFIQVDSLGAGSMELRLSGSGDIDVLYLDCDDVEAELSGSGDLYIQGDGRKASLEITGSGQITALDFPLQECLARITGSGDMHVDVSQVLEARISGSGNVYYRGNPATIIRDITGSGSLIKI